MFLSTYTYEYSVISSWHRATRLQLWPVDWHLRKFGTRVKFRDLAQTLRGGIEYLQDH